MSATGGQHAIRVGRAIGGSLGILCMSVVIALAPPAWADTPPAPSGDVLGTLEAVLNYCSKIDAGSAAGYQQRLKLVVQGADEKAVKEVRESDEYRDAYQRTADLLADVNADEARQTCSQSLVGGR